MNESDYALKQEMKTIRFKDWNKIPNYTIL